VEHHVAAVDQLGEQRLVLDRVDRVVEPVVALEVGDVLDRPGREVVEDDDLDAPPREARSARCDPMKPAPPTP
jgi:hypothetical protein